MLHVYTTQKKKMLKIFIWVYCLFVTCVTVFLAVSVFNSGMVAQQQHQLRNSEIVVAHLKEHTVAILNGFLQYFVLLLITLTPAAAVNQAAAMARELVLSLPGWIPKRYSIIKALICRSFMGKTSLTLWKIYRIDNSFLISAIGTLISYGILVGTLGSVQSSNIEK
ncbi:uncharacterized protein CEXT_219851 [Caerostris extrusa]|uniref:Gustatory receptor n=1 Tax=Caerostris extrusa TaxID=172846 RepID=A0AAV4QMP1_CAEEX|nr:uncharacterized protein CEXT_219851 [Caerostris extrusa]